MKERDADNFSWTLLFLVTSASFLGFSGLAKLLNGIPSHVSLFFKISVATSLLTFISYLKDLTARTENEE
ncbi:hypothetical protein [Terrimonas pollutisoli]|uniref:hypothetical protein n=1 Tax=Terrimonas pollutisoli TaxID=3034147 RepID=UPI0023EDA7B5|nr:hypothetical protein [Terrimonas sp. H1YJ31]